MLQVYGVLVFTLTAGSAFAQIPDKPLVEASATRSSVPLLSATEGSVVELDVAFAGGASACIRGIRFSFQGAEGLEVLSEPPARAWSLCYAQSEVDLLHLSVRVRLTRSRGVLKIFRSGGSVDMFRQSTRPVPVGEIVLGH